MTFLTVRLCYFYLWIHHKTCTCSSFINNWFWIEEFRTRRSVIIASCDLVTCWTVRGNSGLAFLFFEAPRTNRFLAEEVCPFITVHSVFWTWAFPSCFRYKNRSGSFPLSMFLLNSFSLTFLSGGFSTAVPSFQLISNLGTA